MPLQEADPFSEKVKVVEHHGHIDDYDKFIKEQSDPTTHHHSATTAAWQTSFAPSNEVQDHKTILTTVGTTTSTTSTNNILDPLQTTGFSDLQKIEMEKMQE